MERAKDEASRIADDMRSHANKIRENVGSTFKQDGKAYSYPRLTQQLRLVQLAALPVQAISLYMESHRVGLISFLLPLTFICVNAYLVFSKWQKQADGRSDLQNFLNAHNNQTKVQHAIQLLGPFLFALLVHTFSPVFPTYLSSVIFHLADYLLIGTAFACLFLDCFETVKNKIH